jgi:uncharacterized hydrophobic protein (TIGR00271 family)
VTVDDVDRMANSLYVTGRQDDRRAWSAFWVLLLSAVIAGSGVVADATATVIGAMIVAPLMKPILGTALALVMAHRRELRDNVLLILAGAVAVVLIAYLLGLLVSTDVVAETNSQVAGRVHPRLIDLVSAVATGMVGAFALVRWDVSDTLPGVAIAISLVPPLAVVGLTLESGAPDQALGAFLLFATNVAAIVATGTAVLLFYRVRDIAREAGRPVGVLRGSRLVLVAGVLVLIAVPLGIGSWQVYRQQMILAAAEPVASAWAESEGWLVNEVTYRGDLLRIIAVGPPPEADEEALRRALDDAGLTAVDARVTLVIGGSRELPAEGSDR